MCWGLDPGGTSSLKILYSNPSLGGGGRVSEAIDSPEGAAVEGQGMGHLIQGGSAASEAIHHFRAKVHTIRGEGEGRTHAPHGTETASALVGACLRHIWGVALVQLLLLLGGCTVLDPSVGSANIRRIHANGCR